jgi:ribonucleoside-diphosphate reductase alpha chain
MLGVIEKHRAEAHKIDDVGAHGLAPLLQAAREAWDEALALGREHGYRNSQATVLAPTGTISFMMDCDTTGIEPDIALIKYKTLVGGGLMKIVNGSVPGALRHLGYGDEATAAILAHIDETGTIEGAPGLLEEHLPVFDCAFKPQNGSRTVHWLGHVKMMGAAQPFISGAISKTVNLPEEATVEEIEEAYIEGWKHGLKALAIYRDGSKRAQVLSTSKDQAAETGEHEGRPVRRRLPATRTSLTHKFSIEGHEGYITAGSYEDGTPGEIFITMAKEGSTLSGMLDAFATSISLTLQYGVPLRDMVNKFSHMRFEPSGRTENAEIPVAQSIVDYIFRWLASQFLSEEEKEEFGVLSPAVKAKLMAQEYDPPSSAGNGSSYNNGGQSDAPPCANCGWIMVRRGTCYCCDNCGTTSGCS